jgi:hypothetical protein
MFCNSGSVVSAAMLISVSVSAVSVGQVAMQRRSMRTSRGSVPQVNRHLPIRF